MQRLYIERFYLNRADAIVPLADKKEVVQIRISEEQMMKRVRACGATPTSFLSLLLARAIARLHPESAPLAPTVTVAVDLRKTLGTTAAHHSQVGGLFVPMHFTTGFESSWRMKEFTDEKNITFWEINREGETIEI